MLHRPRYAILIIKAGQLRAVAFHFGGHRVQDDVDVFQAAQFILQHLVGFHLRRKFQQRYVLNDPREVDSRFHAGVTAADDRDAFAFKQRAVTVRAVGHAFGAILIFTRYAHVAPFRAGRHDHAARFQHRAGRGFNLVQAAFARRRNQLRCALGVDNVNIVIIHVRLQRARQFLAFSFRHRDVVFNVYGIQHLTTETLAHQAGTDAFTCGVNRRRRARRAGANNQHIVSVALVQLFRRAFFSAGIHFRHDFGKRHTARTEFHAVHEDRRNAHYVALGDFILEYRAVNRRVFNARVQHGHQVQRLHHVRAVVAGERVVGFKFEIAVQVSDLLKQRLRFFRRMTAGPQQRQHQRRKFVTQRRACKARPLGGTRVSNQK